jgi:hypothetical protein
LWQNNPLVHLWTAHASDECDHASLIS